MYSQAIVQINVQLQTWWQFALESQTLNDKCSRQFPQVIESR
jgi:hypothetical protein